MHRVFTTISMDYANQNWGLEQGAGLFAVDFSAMNSSMNFPMYPAGYSSITDTGKVPPKRKRT